MTPFWKLTGTYCIRIQFDRMHFLRGKNYFFTVPASRYAFFPDNISQDAAPCTGRYLQSISSNQRWWHACQVILWTLSFIFHRPHERKVRRWRWLSVANIFPYWENQKRTTHLYVISPDSCKPKFIIKKRKYYWLLTWTFSP